MSDFLLDLGESRFRLTLGAESTELFSVFFTEACVLAEDDQRRHHLTIEEVAGSFIFDSGPGLPTAAAAMLSLEYEIERRVIAEARSLVALHGGAVATSPVGGACLVLGNSEDGKSSTTFQLAELGHRVLCEEVTLVDPDSWRVAPYPKSLSLSAELIADFKRTCTIRGRVVDLPGAGVRYLPPERSGALLEVDGDAAVARVLLPKYSAGASAALTRIAAEEALPEVLGYAFPPNLDTEILFDRMIELLERAEILRFVYGDAASARSALSELL